MAVILAAILDHEDEGHKERWNSELEGAGPPYLPNTGFLKTLKLCCLSYYYFEIFESKLTQTKSQK